MNVTFFKCMKKTEKVSVLPRCREKLFSQDLSTRASHAVVSHRLNFVTRNLNDLKKLQTNIIEQMISRASRHSADS